MSEKQCRNCGGSMPDIQPDTGKRAKFHCSLACCSAYSASRRVRPKRGSQHKGSHLPFTPDLEELFWSRTERREPSACWEWQAARNSDGYGYFSYKGYSVRAHRYSYEMNRGPIPNGLVLDHLCENRQCVNPNHLEPVTNYENLARSERTCVGKGLRAKLLASAPISADIGDPR